MTHPSKGRPLVVAQCPAGDPPYSHRALESSDSGDRLARMCGLSGSLELFEHLQTVNLLERNPGSVWPLLESRERALEIFHDHVWPGRKVVLLGRAVHDAFGHLNDTLKELPDFEWRRTSGSWWACSPHPSGLSRKWNDPRVRRAGEAFWHAVIQ